MKKMMMLCAVAMMATAAFAQSTEELAKIQAEQNELHAKIVNAKPTKPAIREAKKLTKEGWTVPVGNLSIESLKVR